MSSRLIMLACASLVLAGPAQAQTQAEAEAEAEVASRIRALASAFERGDAEAAVEMTSKDLHLIHPTRGELGYDIYVGALRKGLKAEPGKKVSVTLDHLYADGDMVVTGITWTTNFLKPDGTPSIRYERDQEVWRREADGRWRLFRGSSFPANAPPAAAG